MVYTEKTALLRQGDHIAGVAADEIQENHCESISPRSSYSSMASTASKRKLTTSREIGEDGLWSEQPDNEETAALLEQSVLANEDLTATVVEIDTGLERFICRKLDFRLLPALSLMYLFKYDMLVLLCPLLMI